MNYKITTLFYCVKLKQCLQDLKTLKGNNKKGLKYKALRLTEFTCCDHDRITYIILNAIKVANKKPWALPDSLVLLVSLKTQVFNFHKTTELVDFVTTVF